MAADTWSLPRNEKWARSAMSIRGSIGRLEIERSEAWELGPKSSAWSWSKNPTDIMAARCSHCEMVHSITTLDSFSERWHGLKAFQLLSKAKSCLESAELMKVGRIVLHYGLILDLLLRAQEVQDLLGH